MDYSSSLLFVEAEILVGSLVEEDVNRERRRIYNA